MTEKNLKNVNSGNKVKKKLGPAPKDSNWRLTAMNIGKGKEIEGLDTGKNTIDTNNIKFLEEIGFKQNEKGQLTIKTLNNQIESEIVKGKRKVHRRIAEDGKVLYENAELEKEQAR